MDLNTENKSLIQESKNHCYICGCSGKLHCHHIFYGTANRKKSDEDGMVIYLCGFHHNLSSAGIHFNKQLDERVKQQAEKIWIATYCKDEPIEDGIEDFIKRYGRNYI